MKAVTVCVAENAVMAVDGRMAPGLHGNQYRVVVEEAPEELSAQDVRRQYAKVAIYPFHDHISWAWIEGRPQGAWVCVVGTKKAAELLEMTPNAVANLCASARNPFPGARKYDSWAIPLDEVKAYAASNRKPGPKGAQ